MQEADCRAHYAGTPMDKQMLSVSGGIQRIRIPVTGLYKITADGAHGGQSNLPSPSSGVSFGGAGATAWGVHLLEQGTILNVVVGQAGDFRSSSGGGSW